MKPIHLPATNKATTVPSILTVAVLGGLAVLGTASSGAAAEVASPVYGAITLTIKGHAGKAPSALSFLGLGLTRPVVCQGNLESVQGKVVYDQQAHWADDEFNGSNGSCYLEITSGPGT